MIDSPTTANTSIIIFIIINIHWWSGFFYRCYFMITMQLTSSRATSLIQIQTNMSSKQRLHSQCESPSKHVSLFKNPSLLSSYFAFITTNSNSLSSSDAKLATKSCHLHYENQNLKWRHQQESLPSLIIFIIAIIMMFLLPTFGEFFLLSFFLHCCTNIAYVDNNFE